MMYVGCIITTQQQRKSNLSLKTLHSYVTGEKIHGSDDSYS